MRTLLALSFIVITSACGASQSAHDTSERTPTGHAAVEVSSAEAHAMVEDGATLVDVRTPEEYADGHIDGALNIPVDLIDERMNEIPTDRAVVVYCASGRRAARAAEELETHGYQVRSLGGMSNW